MPTWDSVVGWGKREDRVVSKMQTVYPRCLVYRNKQQIMRMILIVIGSISIKSSKI